jgi:hypothetical protein
LVGKPEGKILLRRLRRRWPDVKIDCGNELPGFIKCRDNIEWLQTGDLPKQCSTV